MVVEIFDEGEELEVADHCPQVGDEGDVLADEIEDHSCQADDEEIGFRDELDDHSCQAAEEVIGFDKVEDKVHCCQAEEDDDGLGEVEDDRSCQADEDDGFVYELVVLDFEVDGEDVVLLHSTHVEVEPELNLVVEDDDGVLLHSPQLEVELEIGVGDVEEEALFQLPHVDDEEVLAVVDELSDCELGFLFTTPLSAGLIRTRRKSIALTMVMVFFADVLTTVPKPWPEWYLSNEHKARLVKTSGPEASEIGQRRRRNDNGLNTRDISMQDSGRQCGLQDVGH